RVATALHSLLCGGFCLQRRSRFEVGWQVGAGRHIARLRDDIFLRGAESRKQLILLFLWHFELIERFDQIFHYGVELTLGHTHILVGVLHVSAPVFDPRTMRRLLNEAFQVGTETIGIRLGEFFVDAIVFQHLTDCLSTPYYRYSGLLLEI